MLVGKLLEEFRKKNTVYFGGAVWRSMGEVFEGYSFTDEEVDAAIYKFHTENGELIDPHSVIGVTAGIQSHIESENILVTLATAHPAKFSEVVQKSTGIKPELPAHLSNLHEKEEKFVFLPNNFDDVRNFINKAQDEYLI